MKKLYLKPGFEVIFSLSIIAILTLPAIVLAQNQKDMEITIQNGDTTVNGKNIKDLAPEERNAALKDISRLSGDMNDRPGHHMFPFRNRRGGHRHDMMPGDEDMGLRDSTGRLLHIRKRFDGDGMGRPSERMMSEQIQIVPPPPPGRFDRRNTQLFNYSNIGADGMVTRISFHVSEADDNQADAKAEKASLVITDLTLVPEFSTGKTLLMFTLPSKATAEISLTDSESKQLWSEKSASLNFRTTFVLPYNGIYFLQIKQGTKEVTKKIVKD